MEDLLAITSDEWIEYDTELWLADYNCGPVIDGEIMPAAAPFKFIEIRIRNLNFILI